MNQSSLKEQSTHAHARQAINQSEQSNDKTQSRKQALFKKEKQSSS
jgi:hypothetical protein